MKIFITGFMGSGKTTVGRELAKQLGWFFLDTDQEVERKCNLRISEIFEKWGEEHFRQLEAESIRECILKDPLVVALGGGSLLDEQTGALIKRSGRLVYLKASLDWILFRIRNSRHRPLIPRFVPGDDRSVKEELGKLLADRVLNYQNADLTILVDQKNRKEIVDEIRRELAI